MRKKPIAAKLSPTKDEEYLSGYDIKFRIGQVVYLKTDGQQQERLVTGINLRPQKSVTYCLALEDKESWHYSLEINSDRDIVKATTS